MRERLYPVHSLPVICHAQWGPQLPNGVTGDTRGQGVSAFELIEEVPENRGGPKDGNILAVHRFGKGGDDANGANL